MDVSELRGKILVRPSRRTLLLAALVVFLLASAHLIVSGTSARADIALARTELATLAQVDELTADQLADLIATTRERTQSAYDSVHSPVWVVVSWIPFIGNAADAAMVSAEVAMELFTKTSQTESELRALPEVEGNALLNPGLIKVVGDAVVTLKPDVEAALARLKSLDMVLVPSQINNPVQEVIRQLETVQPYLSQAADLAQVAPVLLGLNEPSEWLVVFTNGAEARPAGGFPGGWGIITATSGKLKLSNLETNDRLSRVELVNYEKIAGRNALELYGSDLSRVLDMGLSPDFELTGALLWNLYMQETTGVKPLGILQMDEHALSNLITVTGPINASGTEVTTENAVEFITKTVYEKHPDVAEKDAVLIDLTEQIFQKLQSGDVGIIQLVKSLLPSINENRLRAWANDESTQAIIRDTALGGQVRNLEMYSHIVAVANGSGNKLEAYINYEVNYVGGQCNLNMPYRDSTLRVTVNNSAPSSGLPRYVTPRLDLGISDVNPQGGTREIIYVHAPLGSELQSATIDGEELLRVSEGQENGRWVWRFDFEIAAKTSRVIVVQITEPAIETTPFANLWLQPMTLEMRGTAVAGPQCNF
jgi:hypothetical protein